MKSARLRLSGLLACILTIGFTSSGDRIQISEGDCAIVYGGRVCTWATTSGGNVVEFGATVPMQTIEGAPFDAEMVFPPVPVAIIPLPAAVRKATGFDHLTIDWESHGHPPTLFAVPHFDFHFYMVDPAVEMAVDCTDLRKPGLLPAGYALPDLTIPGMGEFIGLCVPGMGMHAMLADEVDQVEPFGASMIVGYYGGDAVFLEPMISHAKLLEAKGFSMAVPEVTMTRADVRWPSAFEATYDEAGRAYRFTFSGWGG